jgi:tagatose-1,6-bisphosphate aldolase
MTDIFNKTMVVENEATEPVPVTAETLESLVDTLQELCQRLAPLASSMTLAGGVGLRVVSGQTLTTTALTSAQYTASNLTSRLAVENQTAIWANINNVVGA